MATEAHAAGFPPDDHWSEEQWEAFLAAHDAHARRFVDLVFYFATKYPRPLRATEEARSAWRRALHRFLEQHGWSEEINPLPLLWTKGAERDDDRLAAEEAAPEPPGLLYVPAYVEAADLWDQTIAWAHSLDVSEKDLKLVTWCSRISQIPAFIEQGHNIGYEKEVLAGNIAYVKRALDAANESLEQLRILKHTPAWADAYTQFYEPLYELRNTIGAYVQELRQRASLGID